jgi:hypothetical protein
MKQGEDTMDNEFREIAQRTARSTRKDIVEDRIVSPLARKAGGCATVFFVVLFTGGGVGLALLIGRTTGNVDAIGPTAIGIGLVGGIVLGALVGTAIRRVLRRLLTR